VDILRPGGDELCALAQRDSEKPDPAANEKSPPMRAFFTQPEIQP